MAFETTAFDLTAEEKHATLGEIRCLVLGTGALIARAKKYKSPHDYAEALSSINRALTLATDADACDPSLAPLATCYLYKGHILLGLKLEKDAHEAYAKAAATETREFTDATAPRDEAKRILRHWDKMKVVSKRKERRPAVQAADARFILSLPGKGKPGESVLVLGADGIALPVTIRPGPVRQLREKINPNANTKRPGLW